MKFLFSNDSIQMLVYNTIYIDDIVASLAIPFNATKDFNSSSALLNLTQNTADLKLLDKLRKFDEQSCDISATFSFLNRSTGSPWNISASSMADFNENLDIGFSMNSSNCSVGIHSKLRIDDFNVVSSFSLKETVFFIECFVVSLNKSLSVAAIRLVICLLGLSGFVEAE